jgi:hypothetical protein
VRWLTHRCRRFVQSAIQCYVSVAIWFNLIISTLSFVIVGFLSKYSYARHIRGSVDSPVKFYSRHAWQTQLSKMAFPIDGTWRALLPGSEAVAFGLMNGEGAGNVADGPSPKPIPSKLLHRHNRLLSLLKLNAKSPSSFPGEHLTKIARTGSQAADEHMFRPERGESDNDMSHLTATDSNACDADISAPDPSSTSSCLPSGVLPFNENKTQSETLKACIRTVIRKKTSPRSLHLLVEGPSVCLSGRKDQELTSSSVASGDDRAVCDASLNLEVLLSQFKGLFNAGDYEGAKSFMQAAFILLASRRDFNGASALKMGAADVYRRSHVSDDYSVLEHLHRKRSRLYYSWLEGGSY